MGGYFLGSGIKGNKDEKTETDVEPPPKVKSLKEAMEDVVFTESRINVRFVIDEVAGLKF